MTTQQGIKKRNALRFLSPRLWFSFLGHALRRLDAQVFGVDYSQYHRILRQKVLAGGCDSLLDVGCGECSPVAHFASEVRYRVGVDTHLPSIERSRIAGIHSDYVVANIREIGEIFPARSFDCVTPLEVIEHLSRAEGEKILEQCERIARVKVVVSTPNGFVLQPPTVDNPFQEHISGWTAEEFRGRGYEVIGTAGWKHLRGAIDASQMAAVRYL